jgi:hypothetical protein
MLVAYMIQYHLEGSIPGGHTAGLLLGEMAHDDGSVRSGEGFESVLAACLSVRGQNGTPRS